MEHLEPFVSNPRLNPLPTGTPTTCMCGLASSKWTIALAKKDNSKIYSYSHRKNLIDLSSNFANWLKINYLEIK
jgi:hypothetical protein